MVLTAPRPHPRLVATDLDGTLLGADGTVSPRTRRALDALEDRGLTVVFVTGRPVRWMEPLWEHVGGHGIAICSNGGILYDVREQRVLTARTIDRGVGLEVVDLVRSVAPASRFALERLGGFATEPNFRPHASDAGRRTDVLVGPLAEVFGNDVVKLLALDDKADPAIYRTMVDDAVGHLVTTTYSVVGSLVEMSGAGVTKASTLELWCAEHGIAADEVVAFGDMPNDVDLLRWAGRAYAMANAHDLAKQAADALAPPNDEDGVAQVLEQIFDL